MTKPLVGQKVYLEPCGNQARYGVKGIREYEVKKVGRKYFFVGVIGDDRDFSWIKFYIEDLRQVTDYSPNWTLYFSRQEILDRQEYIALMSEISSLFRYGSSYHNRADKITLEQLRKIKDVLNS
ncbi:beta barrel domain-containing protein [Bacillus cereus group sp. MYBK139-2]|uniref:beta barrel domain-containing protein n=1 Tax=unclassified Bacillus cereus group TaxID=2750818 RepID=UPI003F79640F